MLEKIKRVLKNFKNNYRKELKDESKRLRDKHYE